MSEVTVMREIMVLAGRIGLRLFRNNCGTYEKDGNWIKYGLANPGGADLIGWRPLTITQEMVGQTVAQFTAVEVKSKTGRVTKEQQAFLDIVNQQGGKGIVARNPQEALTALGWNG